MRAACLLSAIAMLLASCSMLHFGKKGKGVQFAEKTPFGPTGVPPQLRGNGGAPKVNATVQDSGAKPVKPIARPPSGLFTPDDEIIFTDPDNPDASLPELSKILGQAPTKHPTWEQSETIAKKRAAREGKPILVWFTDTKNSPLSKALDTDLLATPKFNKWASENVIRLRIDANAKFDTKGLDMASRDDKIIKIGNYNEELRKRYKVLGNPSLLILSPGGEVVGRHRGYKRGDAEYIFGVLKQNQIAAANTYAKYRKKLETKGYREWSDTKGRKVFAKLTSYREGTLTLIEPDGTCSRTSEKKLSQEDQDWIAQQKKLRGIQ